MGNTVALRIHVSLSQQFLLVHFSNTVENCWLFTWKTLLLHNLIFNNINLYYIRCIDTLIIIVSLIIAINLIINIYLHIYTIVLRIIVLFFIIIFTKHIWDDSCKVSQQLFDFGAHILIKHLFVRITLSCLQDYLSYTMCNICYTKFYWQYHLVHFCHCHCALIFAHFTFNTVNITITFSTICIVKARHS